MSADTTTTPPREGFANYLRQLGVLRVLLLLIALVLIGFAGAVTEPYSSGWSLVRGAIVPALVPIVIMVLLFDALMARVLLGEGGPSERQRLRRVIGTDLGVVALLLLAWSPFFYSLYAI
jgi:hypothetical protein